MTSTALDVHRLRFGDWTPSPIKSIAPDPFSAMVAIGREDGDIEIADSSGSKWYTMARVPGRTNFDLRSLVWATSEAERGRLFGISLRGFLFEIDLATLSFKNVQESYGGAVWCVSTHPTEPIIAVGCEDGSVRVFSYASGALDYERAFYGVAKRVLSLAYHPTKDQLFCGSSDGSINCLEASTGRSLYQMSGDLMKGAVTLIWSLLVLADSTVVSGDNRGHVQFWDGNTGTLMVSFHQHTAEILALAVSADDSQIFASGVDCRVTCMRRIRHRSSSFGPVSAEGDSDGAAFAQNVDNHWVYTASHRPHSHDVYALAVCQHSRFFSERKGKGSGDAAAGDDKDRAWTAQPLLISGGEDCKLCAYSINDFVATRPVWVLPTPATGLVSKANDYSVVAMKHRNHVDVWSVQLPGAARSSSTSPSKKKQKKAESAASDESLAEALDADAAVGDSCVLAMRLELKSSEHIHTFAMSSNGRYLAASGYFGFRLWAITRTESKKGKVELTCTVVQAPELAQTFCHALCFSADSARLALCADKGSIHIVDIDIEKVTVRHTLDHFRAVHDKRSSSTGGAHSNLMHAVNHMALSSDGLYLAVSDGVDGVYVYELDRVRLYWKLPACGAAVTAIAFPPTDASNLVVLLAEGVLIYDLNAMTLTRWTEDNMHRISKVLQRVSSPLHGISFDPAHSHRMYVHGQGVCVHVDFSQAVPKRGHVANPFLEGMDPAAIAEAADDAKSAGKKQKRRKESIENHSSNFSAVYAYRSVVDVGCMENQLVRSTPLSVSLSVRLSLSLSRFTVFPFSMSSSTLRAH